jgi:HSP20 family protein
MTMLTRWDPWRDLNRVQEELSRFFDDRTALRAGESVGWTPATDIYEDEEGLSLRFELAGVEPKDVDIRFENGVLTLKGERKLDREDRKDNYHRIERAYGSFTRSFSLPATVDAEKIRAESKNGVLTVMLPKKAEAKPKSIQVKVS